MLTKHPLGNDPLLPPSNELRKEILDQRIVRPLWRLLLLLPIPRLLHLPLLIRKRIRILPRGERYDMSTPVSLTQSYMRTFMGNLSPALIVHCFGNSLAVRGPFCD